MKGQYNLINKAKLTLKLQYVLFSSYVDNVPIIFIFEMDKLMLTYHKIKQI